MTTLGDTALVDQRRVRPWTDAATFRSHPREPGRNLFDLLIHLIYSALSILPQSLRTGLGAWPPMLVFRNENGGWGGFPETRHVDQVSDPTVSRQNHARLRRRVGNLRRQHGLCLYGIRAGFRRRRFLPAQRAGG